MGLHPATAKCTGRGAVWVDGAEQGQAAPWQGLWLTAEGKSSPAAVCKPHPVGKRVRDVTVES